jgi:hypothetical protein
MDIIVVMYQHLYEDIMNEVKLYIHMDHMGHMGHIQVVVRDQVQEVEMIVVRDQVQEIINIYIWLT